MYPLVIFAQNAQSPQIHADAAFKQVFGIIGALCAGGIAGEKFDNPVGQRPNMGGKH